MNIALIPLLVVLLGLAVFLMRRRKQRSGMNARIAGVLVVLLVALGGGALLVRQQADRRNPPTPAPSASRC